MVPVQDVIPSRTTPWVTTALLAVNGVVLAGELMLSEPAVRSLILSYGLVPAYISWPNTVTSLFLHYGLVHAGANMLALWIFGDNLEDRLGHTRFLVFYLTAGVVAGLVGIRASPESLAPIIGASGAVAGVIGGYLALFPHSRVLVLVPTFQGLDLVEVPAPMLLGFWILLQGLAGGAHASGAAGIPVALWVQIGGLGAGALAVWAFRIPERQRVEWWAN